MTDTTRRKMALVVTEILGLVHNGGIATATTFLSFVLADEGYDVTIVYCGTNDVMDPAWARRYDEHGVHIVRLDRALPVARPLLADGYRLYHQLRSSNYGAVVFQDWQGLGFFSMVAKKSGLAFEETLLVHICHGPTPWLAEANRTLEYGPEAAVLERLERGSAELSDAVVSPSRHLIDWMVSSGWSLPDSRHVIPYFTELQTTSLDALDELTENGGDQFDEVVFFGRLEERKGVVTMCRALNRIGAADLDGMALTFLGRPANFSPDDVLDLLDDDVVTAFSAVRFIDDLDQPEAREYLRGPGRVAVIPSLLDNSPCVAYECIEDRVPFLASRAGGTCELVVDDPTVPILFEPNHVELAGLLGRHVRLRRRPAAAYPAYAPRESLAAWEKVLSEENPRADRPTDQPLVTVVIPHHDRPELLAQCVRSVMLQDHPAVEVVVVDDGSEQPSSLLALDLLEGQPHAFPLRVIRQSNQYLGAARNAGIRAATGQLVTFVDDDDIIEPSFVSTLATALVNSGADAVTCAVRTFSTDELSATVPDDDAVWPFIGDLVALAPVDNLLAGAPLMTRRETIEQVGGYHEVHGVGHEDWALAAALVMNGRVLVAVPHHGYRYRLHRTSMLRTGSTYVDMAPVFDALAAHLPAPLRSWPKLIRGLQEAALRTERERHEAAVQLLEGGDHGAVVDHLRREVELRDRMIYLLQHGLAAPA